MTGPVLLTGATGFVGSAVVRALQTRGFAVRALVRAGTPLDTIAGSGTIDTIIGDLDNQASLEQAVRSCSGLIHCAADYRIWVPDPMRMRATNVDGTTRLMEAAFAAGIPRIVHVSSVATLVPRTDGISVDEDAAATPEEAIGPYKRTKVEAERAVLAMVAAIGLPAVIVNPSTPIGPRDRRPTPTGRLILEAAAGRMPACVDSGLNLVHVDDVADGTVTALMRGQPGRRYILGGDNVALIDMLTRIAELQGHRRPVKLPRRLLYPVAWAAELRARLTGGEPMATVDGLRMARYRMYFSSDRAKTELGYATRPYEEGIHDAISWFTQAGLLV